MRALALEHPRQQAASPAAWMDRGPPLTCFVTAMAVTMFVFVPTATCARSQPPGEDADLDAPLAAALGGGRSVHASLPTVQIAR